MTPPIEDLALDLLEPPAKPIGFREAAVMMGRGDGDGVSGGAVWDQQCERKSVMKNGLIDRSIPRVVCAALRKRGLHILGPRHFDATMQGMIQFLNLPFDMADAEQGFIDQWGKFMTRGQAFEVAATAGQIREKTGNPNSKELFSEDLY